LDLTSHRRAEQERSALLRRLVAIQETERRRVARELHDQLGQLSAALGLSLKSLEHREDLSDPGRQKLREVQSLAHEMSRAIHEMARELRPAALDDLGLAAAVASYAEAWSKRSQIKVDLQSAGLDGLRMAPAVETALYRIVQEALTNVLKHAQAGEVNLILERHGSQVQVIVEDNGRGFDVAQVLQSPHVHGRLGLLGMQERLAELEGSLEIESSPGQGTTLFARVPPDAGLEASHE
jgi:signal transduction histidine kinase